MNDFERACAEVDKYTNDMAMQENVLEFVGKSKVATVNLQAHSRLANRLRKLKEKHSEVEIISDTDDVLLAHIPTKWIKINPPKNINITEERRQELAERLRKAREDRK